MIDRHGARVLILAFVCLTSMAGSASLPNRGHAAVQAAVDQGGDVTLLGRHYLTKPVVLTKHGTRLKGDATLYAAPELRRSPLISIQCDGCVVEELMLVSLTGGGDTSGDRNTGIEIRADDVTVSATTIDGFQNGIMVRAEGEFYRARIIGNIVRNVIGAGGGPADNIPGIGEDRGDGIVSWGADTTIMNNQVSAAPGTDARIGIHVEGLAVYRQRPARPTDNKVALIEGNVVSGPFRRGIVTEDVANVVIRNNRIAGGITWWGITATQAASDSLIEKNEILFDRHPANRAGASWSPYYAAIMVAAFGKGNAIRNITVRNNLVRVTRAGGAGIRFQNSGGEANRFAGFKAYGNRLVSERPGAFPAIAANGLPMPRDLRDNQVEGAWNGVFGS